MPLTPTQVGTLPKQTGCRPPSAHSGRTYLRSTWTTAGINSEGQVILKSRGKRLLLDPSVRVLVFCTTLEPQL